MISKKKNDAVYWGKLQIALKLEKKKNLFKNLNGSINPVR